MPLQPVNRRRPEKREYFIKMLELVASRSTCPRRQVGAIITDKEGHVLSTGYNSVPRSMLHCLEFPCAGANDASGDNSNCMAVHAEQNAIIQCQNSSLAHTMYVSCVPCFVCAKMIANTNIQLVIANTGYADERGVRVLLECGITLEVEIE